jgi:drug/metabolite transporter (DMT)-like permease
MTDNSKGILWAFVAVALVSGFAAMAKTASSDYHFLQILFFRQTIVFFSSLPAIISSFPHSLKVQSPALHALRLVAAFTALVFSIWALALLPLTTAVTLAFARVFFVALLASWFLHETVGLHRFGAIIVGFVGVIIVMGPTLDGIGNFHTLVPIIGAFGAGVATVIVRKLSQTDSTATLLVYQSIFVLVLTAVPLWWVWITPDWPDFLFLITMGLLATLGQWVGIRSLRLAEASVVTGIQYVGLIYAALFGFFLFDEIPDAETILGASVILTASAYIIHREARAKANSPA